VTRDEARERLMMFCYGIRRRSMKKVRAMAEYNGVFTSNPISFQFEVTKREFDNEMIRIRRFKEKLELEVGESIGELLDPDGREI
jgi:hypothetical protein